MHLIYESCGFKFQHSFFMLYIVVRPLFVVSASKIGVMFSFEKKNLYLFSSRLYICKHVDLMNMHVVTIKVCSLGMFWRCELLHM